MWACGQTPPSGSESAKITAPGADGSQQTVLPTLPVPPPVSVNALMVGLIDHAGHELWETERDGHAPKTDDQWGVLEHHAIQLAAAGQLIAQGGTGPADMGWARLPDWTRFSREMTAIAIEARKAVRAKDLEALKVVNGNLAEVCERCHQQFKPDLPTEGIAHPHSHAGPVE